MNLPPELESVWWDESITALALIHKDGRFERVNPAFCRMVGYSDYELKQLKFSDLVAPADSKAGLFQSGQVSRGEVHRFEMQQRYIHKRGYVVWGFIQVLGIFKADAPDDFLIFFSQVIPSDLIEKNAEEGHAKKREDIEMNLIGFFRTNWQWLILTFVAFMGAVLSFHYRFRYVEQLVLNPPTVNPATNE